ncbi:hypothetical protein BGZ46_007990 [Entomortierella lignicola]|nr:hypothetical protein BGZ46_007990 [Entomortierella lignicola]
MTATTDPPVKFDPTRTYTFDEFNLLNDWLKTHTLVIEKEPISHFELDSKGRLIPMLQTPIRKEVVVAEIARQLGSWNIQSRINGAVTTSQGGFNFSRTGGRNIRAPDVAFTPKKTYRSLSEAQLDTFKGDPFNPTFVVEVESISFKSDLETLKTKFKTDYIPAGVKLGWLVDPINKEIYIFKPYIRAVSQKLVRCTKHGWKDVSGGDILPGFQLEIWSIDEAISQDSSDSSGNDNDDDSDDEFSCAKCDEIFSDCHSFMKHFEKEHARKKRKQV